MKFTKKDFYFSVITGLITGFLAWRVFEYLEISKFGNYSFSWLIIIVPILWILGVNLGYFLGRWFGFFNQFGKFAAIGFTNAAVYFGILNLLISWSDINRGLGYSVFVAIAFIIGTVHSYFWNKFWVFRPDAEVDRSDADVARAFGNQGPVPATQHDSNVGSGGTVGTGMLEFGKFMGVSVVAGLVNVGIASLVVNFINPVFGLTFDQWANIGGVAGSAVALIFSFVGFKLAVFKK